MRHNADHFPHLSTDNVPRACRHSSDYYPIIMESFYDRLDRLCKKRGGSTSSISVAAGLNRDTVGKMLKKRDQSPTIETVTKIAQSLQTTPYYLAFGVGAYRDGDGDEATVYRPQGLPIVGFVEAGVWAEVDARSDSEQYIPIAPDVRFPSEAQFILRPRGLSMNRLFTEADCLHCVDIENGRIDYRDGDIVIIERRRPDGSFETSAKRFRSRNGRKVALAESFDERWEGLAIPLDEVDFPEGEAVRISAVVIRILKELRV